VINCLVWLVLMGQDVAFAIERAVTVMVIACPHALGLAVPLVVAVSTAWPRKTACSSGIAWRSKAPGNCRPSFLTRPAR